MLLGVAVLLFAPAAMQAQLALIEGRAVVQRPGPSRGAHNENVAVWLTRLDGPVTRRTAWPRFRMVQKGKMFAPRVMVVPLGAEVEFPNHDSFFHNVFSLYRGERFDLGLYETGTSRNVRFDKPGVSFIFCNIHPDMVAYVIAVNTPYFGVSDAQGKIDIPQVEPGRYRVEVWYERAPSSELARLSREITVSGASASLGTFVVAESEAPGLRHTDKRGNPYDPQNAERGVPY